MNALFVRRMGWAAALVFLLAFLLQWLGGNGTVDARGNGLFPDFVSFYAVSEVLHEGRPDLVYQPFEIAERGRRLLGLTDPTQNYLFLYPPFVLPFFQPLVWLPYRVWAWMFFALNLILGGWLAHAIPRLWGWSKDESRAWAAIFCSSLPWWRTVWFGQNSIVLLALVFLGLRHCAERRWFWCGWYWALACYKPQLWSGLVAIGCLAGGWSWVAGFCCGGLCWCLLAWQAGGAQWEAWASLMRTLSLSSENQLWKHSVADVLRTWGVSGPTAMGLSLALLLVAGGVGWFRNRRLSERTFAEQGPLIAAAALGGLLLSPRLYHYDLVLAYPFLCRIVRPPQLRSHPRLFCGLVLAAWGSDVWQAGGIPFWSLLLAISVWWGLRERTSVPFD